MSLPSVMSDSCGIVIACLGGGGADPLALLYVVLSCDFDTFPNGVLSQASVERHCIDPDICLHDRI